MKQYQELIDRLADKTLSFGCEVITGQYKHIGKCKLIRQDYKTKQGDWLVLLNDESTLYQNEIDFEILGHPILIGDVLEKISCISGNISERRYKLLDLWLPCGITKSLQEIAGDVEDIRFKQGMKTSTAGIGINTKQLKKEADNLLKFINEIL